MIIALLCVNLGFRKAFQSASCYMAESHQYDWGLLGRCVVVWFGYCSFWYFFIRFEIEKRMLAIMPFWAAVEDWARYLKVIQNVTWGLLGSWIPLHVTEKDFCLSWLPWQQLSIWPAQVKWAPIRFSCRCHRGCDEQWKCLLKCPRFLALNLPWVQGVLLLPITFKLHLIQARLRKQSNYKHLFLTLKTGNIGTYL